jgi:hypothetical protein
MSFSSQSIKPSVSTHNAKGIFQYPSAFFHNNNTKATLRPSDLIACTDKTRNNSYLELSYSITSTTIFISLLLLGSTMASTSRHPHVILATRIHLGKQATPPELSVLIRNLSTFLRTASSINASKAVIAVDPEETIEGYDLVASIEQALNDAKRAEPSFQQQHYEIIKVSPWGNFVPALNALTSWACIHQIEYGNTAIMFISAETSVTQETVEAMSCHMADDTLVVGAALPGHDYRGTETNNAIEVDLNGRTCPWNTIAMWNLNKLALLGFPLVADGLHRLDDGTPIAAGIEEVATVLMHQKLNPTGSKAKLVKVNGVEWRQNFEDEERMKWHDAKMKSKYARAELHRSLLGGLEGKVLHF